MFLFYLVLLLDTILLQPLRCLIGFALRFCWHPPVSAPLPPARTLEELNAIAAERLKTLDRTIYGQGGDSAKFLGMLAYATGAQEDWENIMALVCEDGSLKRNLKTPYPDDSVPFSGDMLSGFFLAVADRLPKLTDTERARLGKVWARTTWEGFPLLIAHPERGKKVFERGHIWRPWWVMGSEDILGALAWLYLGYKITGKMRYLIAYYAMTVLQAPSLALACPDAQIWMGKVYGIAAHNTHSGALIFYAGHSLTGNVFFRMALKQSYRRHGRYNADIAILAGQATKATGWKEKAMALISDAVDKGTYACPQDTKYLSLIWPPEFVMRAGVIVPPTHRGGDYIWERNPVKGDKLDDAYRAGKGLDIIFPLGALQRD